MSVFPYKYVVNIHKCIYYLDVFVSTNRMAYFVFFQSTFKDVVSYFNILTRYMLHNYTDISGSPHPHLPKNAGFIIVSIHKYADRNNKNICYLTTR